MAGKPKYIDCPTCDGLGFHLTGHSKTVKVKGAKLQLFGLASEDCERCEGLGEVPEGSVKVKD